MFVEFLTIRYFKTGSFTLLIFQLPVEVNVSLFASLSSLVPVRVRFVALCSVSLPKVIVFLPRFVA